MHTLYRWKNNDSHKEFEAKSKNSKKLSKTKRYLSEEILTDIHYTTEAFHHITNASQDMVYRKQSPHN